MKVCFNFWIKENNKNYLGKGKIELLRHIQETGSISKAAKRMRMSYKAAWDAIDTINKNSPYLVVQTITGGKNGGGSVISQYGKELIATFQSLQATIGLLEKDFDDIRDLKDLQHHIIKLQAKIK